MMKIYSRFSLIIIAVLFVLKPLAAQEIYNLDLKTSIAIAKMKSNRMQILQQRLKIAEYQLKASKSSFKTHVNMDMVLPNYQDGVETWTDTSGTSFSWKTSNNISSFLTVNQPLPTDGFLYVRSGLQNLNDYYNDIRTTQIATSVGLQQPIEAIFGYNEIRMSYKQAELNYESSLKQLERAELDLVYEVSSLYYNLLSYGERLEIAKMGYERQLEAFNIASNKFKAGLIREVEALQMEVDLSEASNTLDIARVNYSAQMRLFNELMGLNLNDSVIVDRSMDYSEVLVDPEQAVQLALENRNELKEYQIQIELSEMEIKRRKAAGRIQGDLIFNYNLTGTDKSALSVPMLSSFQDSWYSMQSNPRPGGFNAGLTLSIPLIDWGENKARVNAAKASLEQNKLELKGEKISIEREMRNLVEQLQSSLRRLQLLEKNVVVAEKSFEISRQRYANGEIDSQAIALERERLNGAYISRLESYIAYKLLLSDLMRKTFFDFESGESVGG